MMNNGFHACPYEDADGFADRNRYQHGHMFVGEVENGMRYPFGVYTKAESDARYAAKDTEEDVAELSALVASKAPQSQVDDLADQISGMASETELTAIRARLDALEYLPISISALTASPEVCELGSVQNVTISWTLNKAATSQNINGTPVAGTSHQFTNVREAQIYTFNASDGQTTATQDVKVDFANWIYYGAASDLSTVQQLSSVLSNEKTRSFTANATPGKYIIYAIPARLGYVAFHVGGFEGGFEPPVDVLLTNASGYQEAYKVYRSTNASLGETLVDVKEV